MRERYHPFTFDETGAPGTTTDYFIYDPLGNLVERFEDAPVFHTTFWTSNAPILQDMFEFDAWGDRLVDLGISNQDYLSPADVGGVPNFYGLLDGEIGYKGQYGYLTNPSTGLILAGQREYNPMQRRWMNRDPIGYAGGMNLYAYCGDDPVNEVDPSGNADMNPLTRNFWTIKNWFGVGMKPGTVTLGDAVNQSSNVDPSDVGTIAPISSSPESSTRSFRHNVVSTISGFLMSLIHFGGGDEEIALGTSRSGGLAALKRLVPNAKNYMDLGLDNEQNMVVFAKKMGQAMVSSKKIHFSLDGMSMINDVLTGDARLNPLGSTNWELRQIWDNPQFKNKVTFYLGGKIIDASAVSRLP